MTADLNNTSDNGDATIKDAAETTANHKEKVIPDRPVTNTAAIVSEPNFDALAATETVFSDNAAPPPLFGGDSADAEAPTRGRPALSAEERKARKTERDKLYREKKAAGKSGTGKTVSGGAAPEVSATSSYTAEMVVSTLDLVLITASDGEFTPHVKAREAYVAAWGKYIEQSGRELPAWAEVALMSAVYCLPALRSPTLKERFGFAFMRAKSFFKRGG